MKRLEYRYITLQGKYVSHNMDLRDCIEVGQEEIRLEALHLSVLNRFVIQKCVQFHCLVCRCTILILPLKQLL